MEVAVEFQLLWLFIICLLIYLFTSPCKRLRHHMDESVHQKCIFLGGQLEVIVNIFLKVSPETVLVRLPLL